MSVVILGDIILDINYFSKIDRNAPEADIPIYNIIDTKYILGGAANVANNLNNIYNDVEIVSVIGQDFHGNIISSLLEEKHIKNKLFIDKSRKTSQKHRIFYNESLKTRYDIENIHFINEFLSDSIYDYITNNKNIKCIVISDYNKGVTNDDLIRKLILFSNENNISTFIDPKVNDIFKYTNCFCFKPNLNEAHNISNKGNVNDMIEYIKNNIKCKNLVITCGKDGIILNDHENKFKHKDEINAIDVTGSGDIVLSILVYIYITKNDLELACKISNYVAGLSIQYIGNYLVTKKDIDDYYLNNLDSKIIYDHEEDKIIRLSKNKNIVFTNGCFDILHSAHIKLLKFSKNQGDLLVVGLNTDESIKRNKGNSRPINNLEERKTILALFDFIDYIIIFKDDTPVNILNILKPNTLVKGSDYTIEQIIGKEYCNNIILFDYIKNKSTSLVVDKIKNLNNI